MSRLVSGLVLGLALAALGPGMVRAQAEAPAPGTQTEAPGVAEPEFWEVTGVTAGDTLNLRAGPSTSEPVVAELARGTVLRNLGCTEGDAGRWCEVEASEGGLHGWAAGRYLIDHVEPTAGAETAPAVAGVPPAGTVFCSLNGADETCPFVASGLEDGATELVVTFPDGFERILNFRDGEVWSPDPTDEVSSSRSGAGTVVEVNGVERIEVPDTVVPSS